MEKYDYTDVLIQNLGNSPVDMTIAAGQGILKRGSVLGVITADKQLKLVDSGSSDGSQNPELILLEEVDTESAVPGKRLMMSGKVFGEKLIFGGSDTLSNHFLALKKTGIIAVDADNSEAYDNE